MKNRPMKIKIASIILLFCSLTNLYGQRVQIGFSANMNTTFFHKSSSLYDSQLCSSTPAIRFGLSFPVLINLKPHWTLRTGIGVQIKRYNFCQDKFDISGFDGKVFSNNTFIVAEIPLLIGYKTNWNNDFNIELNSGVVFALNTPYENFTGYQFNGSDSTAVTLNFPLPDWAPTFSTDLYIGISVIKSKSNVRRHQLILSYQYGLFPTTRFDFSTIIVHSSLTKEYDVMIRPRLSTLALTYVYFLKPIKSKKIKKQEI
jgi:hypothetical protein